MPEDPSEQKFFVIATVNAIGVYEDCAILPEGRIYPLTHTTVTEPMSREACEQWVRRHCRSTRA